MTQIRASYDDISLDFDDLEWSYDGVSILATPATATHYEFALRSLTGRLLPYDQRRAHNEQRRF